MIVERITPIDLKEYGSEKFFKRSQQWELNREISLKRARDMKQQTLQENEIQRLNEAKQV